MELRELIKKLSIYVNGLTTIDRFDRDEMVAKNTKALAELIDATARLERAGKENITLERARRAEKLTNISLTVSVITLVLMIISKLH